MSSTAERQHSRIGGHKRRVELAQEELQRRDENGRERFAVFLFCYQAIETVVPAIETQPEGGHESRLCYESEEACAFVRIECQQAVAEEDESDGDLNVRVRLLLPVHDDVEALAKDAGRKCRVHGVLDFVQ